MLGAEAELTCTTSILRDISMNWLRVLYVFANWYPSYIIYATEQVLHRNTIVSFCLGTIVYIVPAHMASWLATQGYHYILGQPQFFAAVLSPHVSRPSAEHWWKVRAGDGVCVLVSARRQRRWLASTALQFFGALAGVDTEGGSVRDTAVPNRASLCHSRR